MKIFKRASIATAAVVFAFFCLTGIGHLLSVRNCPVYDTHQISLNSIHKDEAKSSFLAAVLSSLAVLGGFVLLRWTITGSFKSISSNSQSERHEQHQKDQSAGCTPLQHQSHT